jgi:hypothetical protein
LEDKLASLVRVFQVWGVAEDVVEHPLSFSTSSMRMTMVISIRQSERMQSRIWRAKTARTQQEVDDPEEADFVADLEGAAQRGKTNPNRGRH